MLLLKIYDGSTVIVHSVKRTDKQIKSHLIYDFDVLCDTP